MGFRASWLGESRRTPAPFVRLNGIRRRTRQNVSGINPRAPCTAASSPLLQVTDITYQPSDSGKAVLNGSNLQMPARGLGLIVGSSGAGKTTLLQCIAGLVAPTQGQIQLSVAQDSKGETSMEQLAENVGLVFQFPERHFLADTVLGELTFGWPRSPQQYDMRKEMAIRLQGALQSVGMSDIPVETEVNALSGGFQRRLALALQIVRGPSLLCMDEPLAGLDWRTRAELVPLLQQVKQERAVLIVSHDLQELAPIVDYAWRMLPGGLLQEIPVAQLTMAQL